MGKFKTAASAVPKPDRVVTVPVAAFDHAWLSRPTAPVAVGIRRLCDADVQAARAEASKFMYRTFGDETGHINDPSAAVDAFNDALMRHTIARATTDPNDATKTYFAAAEETVRYALTEDGVARLWDEYLVTKLTTSVAHPKASEEDLGRLARALKLNVLSKLPEGQQAEVRKLARWMLDRISDAGIEPEGESDHDSEETSDEEGGTYVIRATG